MPGPTIAELRSERQDHPSDGYAAAAKIAVVVNYMTGLPHVDRDEELRCMAIAEHAMRARPTLVSRLEHNTFQLERLSPMTQTPGNYGLRITKSASWSSVLTWEPFALGGDLSLRKKTQVRSNAKP